MQNASTSIRLTVRRFTAYRESFLAFLTVLVIAVGATFVIQSVSVNDATRVIRTSEELASPDSYLELSTRIADGTSDQGERASSALEPITHLDAVTLTHSTRSGGTDSDFSVWTIGIERSALTKVELDLLISEIPPVLSAMNSKEISPRGLTTEGNLQALAVTVSERIERLAGVSAAAQYIVFAVSLLSVLWFAHALVVARKNEQTLLLARGQSVGAATRQAVTEGIGVGGVAGLLAVLCGWGVTHLLGTPPVFSTQTWILILGLVLGTSVLAGASLGVFEYSTARVATAVGRPNRSRSPRRAMGVLVAAGIAVGFGAWRLLSSSQTPDALAVISPAMILIGLTVAVLQLMPMAFEWIANGRGRKSVTRFLALTRLRRDFPSFSLPASLTVLASAVIILAAAYVGQTSESQLRELSLRSGADLQFEISESGPLLPGYKYTGDQVMSVAQSAGLPQAAATFMVQVPANVGTFETSLIATNWRSPGTLYQNGSHTSALGVDERNLGSAEVSNSVSLTLELNGEGAQISPLVVLMDSQGAVVTMSSFEETTPATNSKEFSAPVPLGVGDWQVVGVLLEVASTNDVHQYTSQDGELIVPEGPEETVSLVGGTLGFSGTSPHMDLSQFLVKSSNSSKPLVNIGKAEQPVTLPPAGKIALVAPQAQYPVHAVVTPRVLEALGSAVLETQKILEVRVGGATFPAQITNTTSELPGLTEAGMAVDSLSLAQAQLLQGVLPSRATELWLRTDSSKNLTANGLKQTHERAEHLLSNLASNNVTNAGGGPITSGARILAKELPPSATTIFTIAATSVIALSALGITAALNALNAKRRREVRALRGLGLVRAQFAMRRIELAYVFGFALLLGTVVGLVTAVVASKFLGAEHIGWVPLDVKVLCGGVLLLLGAIVCAYAIYDRTIKRVAADYTARADS